LARRGKSALDQVWQFLRSQPGLRIDGHNIFLYDHNEAHKAIAEWLIANQRESAGHSWEIYGDPTPNPAETETTVVYLLK